MMKNRAYITPAVDVLEYMTEQMLAASGVSCSEIGIEYGGVDENGSVNASSRFMLNDILPFDEI